MPASSRRASVLAIVGALAAVALCPACALAQTSVYEPFDYAPGPLINLNGGSGFGNHWSGAGGNWYVNEPGLTFGCGSSFTTLGNRAVVGPAFGSFAVRALASAYTTDSDFWYSFLYRIDENAPSGNRYSGTLLSSGQFQPFIGVDGSDLRYYVANYGVGVPFVATVETAEVGRTDLILVHVVVQEGSDIVSLWINPPLVGDLPKPSAENTQLDFGGTGINGVGLAAGNMVASVDELRFGPTAASVLTTSPTVPTPDFAVVCRGGQAEFSVFGGPSAYAWEVEAVPGSGEWTALNDGVIPGLAIVAGSHTPTLSLYEIEAPHPGVNVRCVITGDCTVVTQIASLLVRCAADFSCDGIVNSTDVGEFINAWFLDQVKGSLVSDWDRNGIVNSTDGTSEQLNDRGR